MGVYRFPFKSMMRGFREDFRRMRSQSTRQEEIDAFIEAFYALHVLSPNPADDPGGVPDVNVKPPTSRWGAMRVGPDQHRYLMSPYRINVVDAGRRSIKTEGLKRRTIFRAVTSDLEDGRFFLCAPTHQQARDVFWNDVKRMVPGWAVRFVRESDLTVHLWQGAIIRVAGIDKPERIEGGFWDGGGITEFGNCRADVFDFHIRPMLARGGWIDLEGTPELGATHYKRLSDTAIIAEESRRRDKHKPDFTDPDYARHTWSTEDVLHLWLGRERANRELDAARTSMSKRAYDQEMRGLWVDASDRAYYEFDPDVHVRDLAYNPDLAVWFCFDFNRSPGVAAVVQEQTNGWTDDQHHEGVGPEFVAVLDEVWIPDESNTKVVSRILGERWKGHRGQVFLAGDPAGGVASTQSTEGSDWDLIEEHLGKVFGDRLTNQVPHRHPHVRARTNAVNVRLRTADGLAHMLVDRSCRHLIDDFKAVSQAMLESPAEKKKAGDLTHISDAVGYMIAEEYPVGGGGGEGTF